MIRLASQFIRAYIFFSISVLKVYAVRPLVDLGYARYEGISLSNGVSQWLGMRFAAPPLGNLRFRAPADPLHNNSITVAAEVCLLSKSNIMGFKMIMHGMNAERILVAAEALGLGYAALRHASRYAGERVVFGRPIGKNQGIAHPLAKAWIGLEAARLMTMQAARMFDEDFATGEYANACKYAAAEAAFTACETAVCSMGGMGYAKE